MEANKFKILDKNVDKQGPNTQVSKHLSLVRQFETVCVILFTTVVRTFNKVFHAPVLLFIMNFVITLSK